ncbi:Protein phosphatase 2C, putative [Perkinsus marinus ATCC 50983]|uniref:Protein phosphatase 2C, putative n=1 Tax=Perkinsus marinus (strain ATCC 50983 / TXsc) TaxID=423536 RepID=C5L977_PERM5|nr:Protein phosphatase 2C, putative [Perkinsus marinus ATCC 50983]EER06725.1 Protein phosphatase 2C, putative [Perkinsus marinus ATCC 50983]|eukprot:XP_002774909.1 Protein phosphatase 2C, putative [Perkinsus marinus ATCC 50983]
MYESRYDGHGGRECVEFVRKYLHINFVNQLHQQGGFDNSENVFGDVLKCLMQAHKETDEAFIKTATEEDWSSAAGSPPQGHIYCRSSGLRLCISDSPYHGQRDNLCQYRGRSGSAISEWEVSCVSVIVLIMGNAIICANTGDARAVLSRNGRAIALSNDQRPSRQDEFKRIREAGGFVFFGRVLGKLAVSRAFGDLEYKTGLPDDQPPLVIPDPEIHADFIKDEDEFIVIACDGLFDVLSSQEVVDFVRNRLSRMPKGEQDPEIVCHDLVNEAILEKNSRDNVTCMIVMLKRSIKGRN